MSVKFGTSGLRGLANDLLDGAAVRHVVAFVRHLLDGNQVEPGAEILVGRDLRTSSPELSVQCLDALAASGMQPVDCGIVPTPALALLAMNRGQAAIMVTGSHIPADRNGLKFYSPSGEITKADEEAISTGAGKVDRPACSAAPRVAEQSEIAWLHYRKRYLPLAHGFPLAGKRIGIFQHSSVVRDFLHEFLNVLGAETVLLGRSHGFEPVDTEALEAEVEAHLREWAAQHKVDAIISTDADGDRPLVTDEDGCQIRGDILGLITARFLSASHAITPVTSSSGLERIFEGQILRCRVGSPYVIAAMEEAARTPERLVVGFEANGGFFLATRAQLGRFSLDPLPTRDSILPILATLMAPAPDQPLSAMVESFTLPVARSGRLSDYASDRSTALMAWLVQASSHMMAFLEGMGQLRTYDDIDGLRMSLGNTEMVHLRASGNAPEMRCYVEAPTSERAAFLLDTALQRLASFEPPSNSNQ